MGAAASSVLASEWEGTGLGDLPENCAAEVLARLDPPEICRLARLGRAFRGAAAADPVWELKLPDGYWRLLEKGGMGLGVGDRKLQPRLSKKEIYARLCRSVPFDGGTKEFWLEKWKGRVCLSISSKALLITSIDDRRHWNHVPTDESRFHAVAYLRQIWWFEVGGEIEFPFPPGTYSLYFRLHLGCPSKRLGRRIWTHEHVHGWDIKPVQFQLSTSDGQHAVSHCFLEEPGRWKHYRVGDFLVQKSNATTKIKFSMKQIDCTHTKGGLSVDSVLVYPKGFRPEKV